eukprot:g13151.t1
MHHIPPNMLQLQDHCHDSNDDSDQHVHQCDDRDSHQYFAHPHRVDHQSDHQQQHGDEHVQLHQIYNFWDHIDDKQLQERGNWVRFCLLQT